MIDGQGTAAKCANCGLAAHHECKDQVPSPTCGLDMENKRGRIRLRLSTDHEEYETKWHLKIQGRFNQCSYSPRTLCNTIVCVKQPCTVIFTYNESSPYTNKYQGCYNLVFKVYTYKGSLK